MSQKFEFTELVHSPIQQRESAALGATGTPADRLVEADVGKCVVMGGADNFELAADGNDIEGVIGSIEPWSVNTGFSFGSVIRAGRLMAMCPTGSVVVRDEVVAAAQGAVGTANNTRMYPLVRAGNGTLARWRCMRVVVTDPAGDTILIERVV